MLAPDTKILIVGLGLIGGSYAEGLKKAGYEVGAVTRSQGTLDFALKKGIIDSGTIEVERDYVSRFDIVVFALYPHVLLSWIGEHQDCIKSGALLTDVTGVKRAVVYEVQRMLRPDLEFVGAHPMAGREVYGVENADSAIFKGANYIVTPTEANSERAVQACEDLGRVLGFTNITRLSPERHDEMIGFVSQLTHCIAICLMTCSKSEHLVDYTGDSFRDLTRIANINEKMWSELFLMNKQPLLDQMDSFIGEMQTLRKMLSDGDKNGLCEKMKLSTKRRALFNKK